MTNDRSGKKDGMEGQVTAVTPSPPSVQRGWAACMMRHPRKIIEAYIILFWYCGLCLQQLVLESLLKRHPEFTFHGCEEILRELLQNSYPLL
jgi:hypothetical protein